MNDSGYSISQAAESIERVKNEIAKVFIGQSAMVEELLVTMLAGGHILVEGVPGLGKTLLVRAAGKAIGAESKRVQFTPDLMPSDISGHIMMDAGTGNFITKKGPVFTNFLIADEINRAPAKTQAALFEAMQEFQVSLDGISYPLPRPFLCLATQNPFEHEGTYPLPDAQKDRFIMKIVMDYPAEEEEIQMVNTVLHENSGAEISIQEIQTVLETGELMLMQDLASRTRVDDVISEYAVRLCRATRIDPGIQCGAGPRGSLALIRCARAKALIQGRSFVIPDDVQQLAVPVLAHRIVLSAESELEGYTESQKILEIVKKMEAPRT